MEKVEKKNLNFFRAGRESNEGLRNGRTRVFTALNDHADGRGRAKTVKTSFGQPPNPEGVRPPIHERSEIVGHNRGPKTTGPKISWPTRYALHFMFLHTLLVVESLCSENSRG